MTDQLYPEWMELTFKERERWRNAAGHLNERSRRLYHRKDKVYGVDLYHLINNSNSRCKYCKEYCEAPTFDHYKPLFSGGRNVIENLVIACDTCNGLKDNMEPEDFYAFLAKRFSHSTRARRAFKDA